MSDQANQAITALRTGHNELADLGNNMSPDDLTRPWARWDAIRTPTERAEGFLLANEALVQRFETLDKTTRAQLRIDLGFLPAPVSRSTRRRYWPLPPLNCSSINSV
ncbi:MAG: hypothetical protein JO272_14950 [Pseudonocardiales bacterium]|nr:hypothetical protein [Pseudonocardiales bacterium]